MTYVLEKTTEDDQQKILALADERQRIRLKAYGFFRDRPDLAWAINKEKGYFLMNAPRQGDGLTTPHFFFYFNGKLFNLSVVSSVDASGARCKPVRLSEWPATDELELFKSELRDAFAVHCLAGMPEIEALYVPTFEIKGE